MKNSFHLDKALEFDRFEIAAKELDVAVFEWDIVQGTFFSSAAYDKYALSSVSPEIVFRNEGPRDIIYPEDWQKLNDFFAQASSKKDRAEAVLRMKMMDGSFHWCRMIGLFYRDSANNLEKVLGLIVDINAERERSFMVDSTVSLLYRTIVENSSTGTFVITQKDHAVLYMNRAVGEIFDVEQSVIEKLVAESWQIRDEELLISPEKLGTLTEEKFSVFHLHWHRKKHLIVRAKVLAWDGIAAYIFYVVDETMDMREHLERETHYKEKLQLRRAASKNAVASAILDLMENKIVEYESSEKRWLDILSAYNVDLFFQAILNNIIDCTDAASFAQLQSCTKLRELFGQGQRYIKFRHRLTNDPRWFQSSFELMSNPYTNRLECTCILTDITEAIRSEEIIKELMAMEYDYVAVADLKNNVVRAFRQSSDNKINRFMRRLHQTFGLNFFSAFAKAYCLPEDREKVIAANNPEYVLSRLEQASSYENTYIIRFKNRIRHKRTMYSYLGEDKNLVLVATQDVTKAFEQERFQRRKIAAALAKVEKANNAKNEFLAQMSHDMRTPMSVILGLAALSKTENDVNILHIYLHEILESGQYLLGMLNDTLDFQRMESGKMTIVNEPVEERSIVDSIKELTEQEATAKGVELVVLAKNIDQSNYLNVDPIRLKQIFMNLLLNAVKFTPRGGSVTLTIEGLANENGLAHRRIMVQDTGIGMSEEFMQNGLFKAFSQEKRDPSQQFVGTGLGLSIVHKLVEMMGGTIEVESAPGMGTTFTLDFFFPQVPAERVKSIEQDKRLAQINIMSCLKGKKLLIVEDQRLNAFILQKILEKAGCQVTWKANGQLGVEAFAKSKLGEYAAVLMDIKMPVLNGYKAARAIRFLDRRDAALVPIIALSANAYEEDLQKSLAVGMSAHLAKPVNPEQLYSTLAKMISTVQLEA